MSRLPEPEGLVETKEQLLKMQCPGCRMIFYWFEHHPYCSAECSEVERAAQALKRDNDESKRPSHHGVDAMIHRHLFNDEESE